jgi:3-dehydroquinate synthase
VKSINVRFKPLVEKSQIYVGDGILNHLGREARALVGGSSHKIALISNPKVFGLFGKEVTEALNEAGFAVRKWLMGDGERCKNLQTLQHALEFLSDSELSRTDIVLSLGGGVVGDLAGMAAALHLRGISLIHVPTTFLAQIDASIGGKTGVNTRVGKNSIGAFHQPIGVWIDRQTLGTLPRRELTAGWCEAVKQGAVGSSKLFRETYDFLQTCATSNSRPEPSVKILLAHSKFKASIVSRDPREAADCKDHNSRRILNFGHTTAHALESITGYRRFKHGEAVGYGMMVAGEISMRLGLLSVSELELLRAAIRLCGHLPRADDLDMSAFWNSLRHDKKHAQGDLHWVLLERIGRSRIVSGKEISRSVLRASLQAGLRQST